MSFTKPRPGLGKLNPGSRLQSSLKPVYVTKTGQITEHEYYRGERTHRHPKRYYYDAESDRFVTERQYAKQSEVIGIGYASKEQKAIARFQGYMTPRAYQYRMIPSRQNIDVKVSRVREQFAIDYAEWLTEDTGDYYSAQDVEEQEEFQELADELEELLRIQRDAIDDTFSSRDFRREIWLQISEILNQVPGMDIQQFWSEVSP